MLIPIIDLAAQQKIIQKDLDNVWHKILKHGCYINGPEIQIAEKELALFCNQEDSVLVSSGTDALVLALRSINIGIGDIVIVPDFTFIAPVQAVVSLGATAILVDIDINNFSISIDSLKKILKLNKDKKIKALISVDLFGCPADYTELNKICDKHNISLIADSAQSFGAEHNGIKIGKCAPITTTSFYPAKPLGVYGDGGAVISNNKKVLEKVRKLRNHGASTTDKYIHEEIGYNARLDSLQAGILSIKLSIFEKELLQRQSIAEKYYELLDMCKDIVLPKIPHNCKSSWAQFTIRVEAKKRNSIVNKLQKLGIGIFVHYPRPIHLQPPYSKCQMIDGCPLSIKASQEVMSIPFHAYLKYKDQKTVAKELINVINES